jgi:hypothetical protein
MVMLTVGGMVGKSNRGPLDGERDRLLGWVWALFYIHIGVGRPSPRSLPARLNA